jgi:AraC-like DNA-binding protein
MSILNYSREHIQQLIRDGIAPVQALRDYDIAKAKMEGKKMDDIAFDNGLSRRQTYRVINKQQGKL